MQKPKLWCNTNNGLNSLHHQPNHEEKSIINRAPGEEPKPKMQQQMSAIILKAAIELNDIVQSTQKIPSASKHNESPAIKIEFKEEQFQDQVGAAPEEAQTSAVSLS